MKFRFRKHYTRDEARALLPEVRLWLRELTDARQELSELESGMAVLLDEGNDVGGEMPNRWVKTLARLKTAALEFHRREIQLKDLDRGLIDFPTLIGGREAFLCWEQGEEDIEHWHDLDSGYAGRERLRSE